jgi:hypothetical protein
MNAPKTELRKAATENHAAARAYRNAASLVPADLRRDGSNVRVEFLRLATICDAEGERHEREAGDR